MKRDVQLEVRELLFRGMEDGKHFLKEKIQHTA
jgi:hypothetical protein